MHNGRPRSSAGNTQCSRDLNTTCTMEELSQQSSPAKLAISRSYDAWTRSSAIAERPRDASCLSVVSFNIPTAQFLLLFTATSDLLVHKILLNYVLLSPIVSGGVWPNPPGQTPLGHNPPCLLPFVGQLGSGPRLMGRIGSVVRVNVSFQQKYPPGSVLRCPMAAENGVMTKGVVFWGVWPPFISGV